MANNSDQNSNTKKLKQELQNTLRHHAGTSNDSDKCAVSKDSDTISISVIMAVYEIIFFFIFQ